MHENTDVVSVCVLHDLMLVTGLFQFHSLPKMELRDQFTQSNLKFGIGARARIVRVKRSWSPTIDCISSVKPRSGVIAPE